ncbi:MAG: hypothetical protein HOQ44_20010, partial [Nocardia sp.]|nr:hypothetical protein [Nocardia sp.]
VLVLNERWAINREYLEISNKISVDEGYHPPFDGSAWRALFAHELTHVAQWYAARALVPDPGESLDTDVLRRYQAEEWRKVLPQLEELFAGSNRPADSGGLVAWLREVLSGYSFKADGTPNFGEAFAEARSAVLHGLRPERAEQILYAHQVESARAETERRRHHGEQPVAFTPDAVSPVSGLRSMPSGDEPAAPEGAIAAAGEPTGPPSGLAALGPETFARVEAAKRELAALPGYEYIVDLPMPEPGDTFGADWIGNRGKWLTALQDGKFDELGDIELTEKDFIELHRIVQRFPLYMTLALIVAGGLSVDQLLNIRKMGWGQLFVKQTKITSDGETIDVWKFRTMRKGNPLEPSSRKIEDKTTLLSRFARDTSLDELPQLLAIATGTMQYFSGRPLLDEDHERMKAVHTAEEYEFWVNHQKDDLWSALHFPGCRAHEPESETYLRARYLAAYIWSEVGSRAAQEYMMKVVDRYLASVVTQKAPILLIDTAEGILRGMAELLPGNSGQQFLDGADSVVGGPVRRIVETVRDTANRISNRVYPLPGGPEPVGFQRRKMRAAIDFVDGEIAEPGAVATPGPVAVPPPARTPWSRGRARTRQLNDCVASAARFLWALGNDRAAAPAAGAKGWRALQTAIGAKLQPVPLVRTTAGADPLRFVADAVADPANALDSAVVLVDDGERMHTYVVTNIAGTAFIHDTAIDRTDTETDSEEELIPRVRSVDDWEQPYTRVQRAHVAYFTTDEAGGLEDVHRDTAWNTEWAPPRDGEITGPPTDADEPTPDEPVADREVSEGLAGTRDRVPNPRSSESGRPTERETPAEGRDRPRTSAPQPTDYPAELDTGPEPANPNSSLPADPPLTAAETVGAHRAVAKLRDHLGPGARPESLLARVDPAAVVAGARARAVANAGWWHALSPAEQRGFLRMYPHLTGNADGIPYRVRDRANRLYVTRELERFLRRKPPRGWRSHELTTEERIRLRNLLETRNQLAVIERESRAVGVETVQLIAFDPGAYGGNGRIAISHGDADAAQLVTRHIGGVGARLRAVHNRSTFVLAQLETAMRLNPGVSMAAINDIGYRHPTTASEVGNHLLAEVGGYVVARDLVSYNATREAQAALPGGAPVPELHTLTGHSFGSTTVCYAGRDGRLANEIDQIILSGSPGAGPITHAGQFGVGEENVYVMAAYRDLITWLGAEHPGKAGRLFNRGLGPDPAVAAWGGRRVKVMPPDLPEFHGIKSLKAVHQGYNAYADPTARIPAVSLLNFGLITVGRGNDTVPATPRGDSPARWRRIASVPIDPERSRRPGGGPVDPPPGQSPAQTGFDIRQAADLPVRRVRGRSFTREPGHVGPELGFHHHPDDPDPESWYAGTESSEGEGRDAASTPWSETTLGAAEASRGAQEFEGETDDSLFVVAPGARESLAHDEPLFVADALDPGDEDEFLIADDAQVRFHPDLAGLLPAADYRVRGTSEGLEMSPRAAAALRRAAVTHGEQHDGNNNRVHLFGDFAVREPKSEVDSSTNSLVADYQLWPHEYRTIEAIVRTAVRLELPRLVARLPQILYVETDEAGNVVFEIHRRIHGRPVDRLYLSEVRSLLTDLEPVFAEIPVPQELLPLPEGYPASGDSAGFFTMLVDHLESQYQTARRDEVIGPVLRVLGLPDSLAPELSALAAQVRSQPFRLLHADITSANILGLGKDAAVLVDFGLALYGPPDFELAILLQRDAKGATENSFIPAALQPYITLLDAMRVFNDLVRLIQQTDYRVLDPTRAQVTAHYLTRALPRAEDIWRKDGFTVANTLAFIRRILRLIEDLAASSPLYVADGAAALLRPDSAADPEAQQ